MQRTCKHIQLSKPPLVLVLCQLRISPIRQMAQYAPEIQEALRRQGFPWEDKGKMPQVSYTLKGINVTEQDVWTYHTKDRQWSVTITTDSISIHTFLYKGFENFAEKLVMVADHVFKITDHYQHGALERLGLRYMNAISPSKGSTFREYIREGFHGMKDANGIFLEDSHALSVQMTGRTKVNDGEGLLNMRLTQNDQGMTLPAELMPLLLVAQKGAGKVGELITLVDIDHSITGNFSVQKSWLEDHAYKLHDAIFNMFYEHVVTEKAIEEWG